MTGIFWAWEREREREREREKERERERWGEGNELLSTHYKDKLTPALAT